MAHTKPHIEYVFLSRNCGLKVSNMCLGTVTFGTWQGVGEQSTEEEAHKILDKFVELGGNFIDTANIYSCGKSEEYIGTWLQKRQNRNKMVFATKCRCRTDPDNPNGEGLSRKHILQEVEASLRRLQTDYIDLYQIHNWDDGTPVKEVLSTMDDLVHEGKVRYVGGSNLTGWQLQKIVDLNHYLGYSPWVTLQQEYSLAQRYGELEAFEVCKREGLGVLPYSPLRRGLLTGKYKKGQDPPEGTRFNSIFKTANTFSEKYRGYFGQEQVWKVVDTVQSISEETGKKPSQVALRWLLQKPHVTSVIIGATTVAQLEENMDASTGWRLSEEQMTKLDQSAEFNIGEFYSMVNKVQGDRKRELPGEY